jgi:hypothetical protein
MGRFRTWIDRARQSRPGRRRAAGTTVRRRSLAFEQFESRLALSAATQTLVEIDASNLISRDQLESGFMSWRQWQRGAADSSMFRVVPLDDGEMVELVYSPNWQDFSLKRPVAVADLEGGSITLASGPAFAFDFGLQAMTSDRASEPFAGQVQAMLQSAFQPRQGGDALSEYFLSDFDAGGSGALDQHNLTNAIDLGPAAPPLELGGIDNFGDAFDAVESQGPQASVSPPSASPPVLRITISNSLARAEGGVIDLTAMAGPTSLTSQHSHAHIASGGTAPTGRLASADASARAAMPVESMRARAVVFEVASSVNANEADLENALRRVREQRGRSADAPKRAGDHDSAGSDVARQLRVLQSIGDNANGQAASSDASTTTAADGDRDSARQQRSAEAFDEALAELLDERDDRPGQDDGGAFSPTAPQKAGLALAVAIGAAPLVKRARRARPGATIEQASDPERESEA